jgi:hypothetical protein
VARSLASLARRLAVVTTCVSAACASTDGLSGGLRDGGSLAEGGEGTSGGPADGAGPSPDASADGAPDGDAALVDTRPDAAPTPCAPQGGLVGYWRFDESGGTTVADCSGNALTGTLTNGDFVPAIYGNGVHFSGNGLASLGNPGVLKLTGALSIAAWVFIADFSGNGRILAKGGDGTDRGWELNVEGNGVGAFRVATTAADQVEVLSPVLPANTWIHLAGTFEPNVALRIYVNGALAGTQTNGVPASIRDSTQGGTIGQRGDGCCGLKGTIDELRLYSRTLAGGEVRDLSR